MKTPGKKNGKPSHLLRRLLSVGLVLAFTTCVTVKKNETRPDNMVSEELPHDDTGTIRFNNNTQFTVHLVQGSGRKYVTSLNPYSSELVPNRYEDAQTYYPLFDVPLTSTYVLNRIRPENPNFYYLIDKWQTDQKIDIQVPPRFYDTSTYIIFTNNNKIGGVWLTTNDNNSRMKGWLNIKDTKYNINQGETIVYQENHQDIRSLRVNPNNKKFGEFQYKQSYAYSFTFDGSEIKLTDSRPLHRVGESAWVKTMPNSTSIMPLVMADGGIHLFVSTDKSITRYVYDSAGNLKEQVQNGESFKINTAIQAGDGFFIAGQTDNRNTRPVARIHNVDGTTRHIFEPSNEYPIGRFFAVSQQNENAVWLLAGDGKKTGNPNNLAYARLVRNEGGKFSTLWELGGSDFSDYGSGIHCGDIQSTVYDNKRACWLVTGETIEKGIVSGAYIAEIDNNGKIKINSSFKGMTFYKILTNHEEVCFLAGEEYRGNETYAVLIKYNLINGQFQRIPTRPPISSSYHDAVFDHENKHIAMAGVMQEESKHGQSGVPFIESVNIERGTSVWREKLSVPASLVTAIAPAPDYGFALTLSGIDEKGNYNEPFMIIRVNSQGKL